MQKLLCLRSKPQCIVLLVSENASTSLFSKRLFSLHVQKNQSQKTVFTAEEAEELREDLDRHREMYVPKVPLNFDKGTGKLLVYQTDDLKDYRRIFRMALTLPTICIYCGVRAVQKRSWWRILLWSLPTLISSRILFNGINMMSIAVTRLELKEDGKTLVMHTMLGEEVSRKKIVKV